MFTSGLSDKFMRFFEYVMNLAFINAIFILFSVPLFTWFTAVIAMYYSIKQWIVHDDQRVFKNFIFGFRQFFRKTWWMSFLSTIIFIILASNLYFLGNQQGGIALFSFIITLPLILLFMFVHFSLFSIIVYYPNESRRSWLKYSFYFSLSHPLLMGLCLLFLVLISGVFWKLPTLIVTYGWSIFAMVCFSMVSRFFTTRFEKELKVNNV